MTLPSSFAPAVQRRFTALLTRCGAGAYLALAVLIVICLLSSESFGNSQNLLNILRQVSYSGLIALGMTFVIAGGGIDLAVGSLFALSGVVAVLAANQAAGLSASPWPAFALAGTAALTTGVLGAAANGTIIVLGRVPSFIATLGTYSIYRSLALYLADSGTLTTSNPLISAFGSAELAGLPVPAWFLLAGTASLALVMNHTAFGKHVCALGAGERVARYALINTARVRFLTYLTVGAGTGVSAFLFVGRLGSVSSSNAGMLYELDAIAAVIIGGAPMSGGRGSLWGTLAGVLVLGVVSNILDLWGVNVTLQGLVKGLVIIISVLIQKKEAA